MNPISNFKTYTCSKKHLESLIEDYLDNKLNHYQIKDGDGNILIDELIKELNRQNQPFDNDTSAFERITSLACRLHQDSDMMNNHLKRPVVLFNSVINELVYYRGDISNELILSKAYIVTNKDHGITIVLTDIPAVIVSSYFTSSTCNVSRLFRLNKLDL